VTDLRIFMIISHR